jgi:hypothetical protein
MSDPVVVAIIGSVATIAAAAIGLLLKRGKQVTTAASSAKQYGVRITSPVAGTAVAGHVEVSGVYAVEPPPGSLFLVNASPDGPYYWPCVGRPIEVLPSRRAWRGSTLVNSDTRIIILTIGASGRALFDFYEKVGKETDRWVSISRLTPDVVEHDQVVVRLKAN